ncbi:hypothetical protein BDN70DRAFT_701819 [Pholiota conissans]|uniref:Uncharacterized protein n=1 Tax=Pholiota conissans TaxID=109636 RepID=A0A9P5Z175_9AGAR|nr:hypothetical protein BDN70DRAFT_701819 [Pholiota conissans]
MSLIVAWNAVASSHRSLITHLQTSTFRPAAVRSYRPFNTLLYDAVSSFVSRLRLISSTSQFWVRIHRRCNIAQEFICTNISLCAGNWAHIFDVFQLAGTSRSHESRAVLAFAIFVKLTAYMRFNAFVDLRNATSEHLSTSLPSCSPRFKLQASCLERVDSKRYVYMARVEPRLRRGMPFSALVLSDIQRPSLYLMSFAPRRGVLAA